MPPRFDDETRTLRLSVHDLLEHELGRSLGFANRGGYERLWLGQAIHSEYQQQAIEDDPTYQAEVTLKHEFTHRGWQILLHGRLDGLRRDGEQLVVEEIKSVRAGQTLAPAVLDTYRRQALIYAWLLGEQQDCSVRAELVLIEIGSTTVDRQEIDLDPSRMRAVAKRRLNTLIHDFEADRTGRAERREAASRLEFPFYKQRQGQDEIVERTALALGGREHLLVEAPTGIGKTVASLFPVLRYALAHDKRVFVLTAKTLQQDMATKVLDLLNRDDAFRSLRLRAKAKMCANDEVICHEEYCRWAKDYWSKLQRTDVVGKLLAKHANLEPDAIYADARTSEVCPFEVSLELSRRVQAVVCDYNYAFDPWVALTDFGQENDLSDTILVIDEAHNLVDRGRGYYSPTLAAARCQDIARNFGALAGAPDPVGAEIEHRIRALAHELARLIEDTAELALPPGESDASVETRLPDDELIELRAEYDRAFIDYLEYRRETRSFRAEDPFVDLYFDLLRFLNTLQVANTSAFSHCASRDARGVSIHLLCKDASKFLGKTINRCHSVIALSATLSPHEFFRDLLGFKAARTSEVRVPSPFPSDHRVVVIDDAVNTTYKQRERNFGPIAERLAEFVDIVPGNCLALFPSYKFLAEVNSRLPNLQKRVLVQARGDGERQRQEILQTLRGAVLGDVLLLAVAGGVFAEGVDYPGEMLKAVTVVSPCLPGLSLEQKLLENYYEDRFGRGFEYAFVIPGMTRVIQAAGRLIRSDKDTGVIALIGQRFANEPYRDHLPPDWYAGQESATGIRARPSEVAERFFHGREAFAERTDDPAGEPAEQVYEPVDGGLPSET